MMMEESRSRFWTRAVALGEQLKWEVIGINFETMEVTYRIMGAYRSYYRLTVGRMFFESLEAAMEKDS